MIISQQKNIALANSYAKCGLESCQDVTKANAKQAII